jgi:predicted RNA binding protein YcfA (HicA-like mRNA interferase family)
MAAQLRPLKGREVLRKLRKAGFEIVRIKGSAYYLRNPRTGRFTSVHVHGNRDIPLGTLRAIVIEQAGLSIDQFNEL